jgi:hypothetical protein
VNLVPELTETKLSDADRTGHLSKLYQDLIFRLRLAKDVHPPISIAAAEHGRVRHAQGYTASMLIEESRVFQVATFGTLHLHKSELDQNQISAMYQLDNPCSVLNRQIETSRRVLSSSGRLLAYLRNWIMRW